MAEGGDKKHEATPYRRQKAREEGQLARSQDLGSAVVLLSSETSNRWIDRVSGELTELRGLGDYMTDLAALTVDPRSGHILVMSQESHLLVELNEQYQPLSFITLLRGLNGLDHYIPQAEGVALDAAGNLYMVSEHNLFYVFRKR